jgi:hypothetical protein
MLVLFTPSYFQILDLAEKVFPESNTLAYLWGKEEIDTWANEQSTL